MPRKPSLRARLGSPPLDDSLEAVSWFVRALSAMADELLDEPGLTRARRRTELLKLADRVAKLRDLDRLGRAERTLVEADEHMAVARPGPELTDAGDLSKSARAIATRRGKPPRRSLR